MSHNDEFLSNPEDLPEDISFGDEDNFEEIEFEGEFSEFEGLVFEADDEDEWVFEDEDGDDFDLFAGDDDFDPSEYSFEDKFDDDSWGFGELAAEFIGDFDNFDFGQVDIPNNSDEYNISPEEMVGVLAILGVLITLFVGVVYLIFFRK